jgi:hypothetical protein
MQCAGAIHNGYLLGSRRVCGCRQGVQGTGTKHESRNDKQHTCRKEITILKHSIFIMDMPCKDNYTIFRIYALLKSCKLGHHVWVHSCSVDEHA